MRSLVETNNCIVISIIVTMMIMMQWFVYCFKV
jgi:hypothetical protein